MMQELLLITVGLVGVFTCGYAVGLNQNLFHKSLASLDRTREHAESTTRIIEEIKESFGQRPGSDGE